MSNPAESDRNGARGVLTLPAAEQRIAELEAEVIRLRGELAASRQQHAVDRALLVAHIVDDMPKTEEEFLRLVREGRSLRELLDELEHEFGLDRQP